jgi:purine-cytosine permease-like protein
MKRDESRRMHILRKWAIFLLVVAFILALVLLFLFLVPELNWFAVIAAIILFLILLIAFILILIYYQRR